MSTFSVQIKIKASKQTVWNVLADIGAISKWNPGVIDCRTTTIGEIGLGSRRRCELGGKSYLDEEMVEWKPFETLTMRIVSTTLPFKTADVRFALDEERTNETTVTVSPSYQLKFGVLGELLDLLFARSQYRKGEEGASDLTDRNTVRQVRMSDLFRPGKDTLILYDFMYGPSMQQPCPMCTSMLDGLNGNVNHAMQRINFAIVAKSPILRICDLARQRGWANFRILSSAKNTYNRDYHGETADGSQMPALNVLVRRGGKLHHFYNTELLFASAEKGQNPRHVDLIWPLWNLFDLTPDGRGADWYPKLSYGS